MLTSYSDDEALFGAIMAGAAGYLLKQVTGRRPRRRRAHGGRRRLTARPQGHRPGPAAAAPGRRANRSPLRVAQPAGTTHPRADRRRPDQPADRRRDVPGREDGQELRLLAAAQARLLPPHRSRRLRRRAAPRRNRAGAADQPVPTTSGERDPPTSRVPPPGSGRTDSAPPHSPARCSRLRSPLRARSGSIPTPSSSTSITSSAPASTVRVTACGRPCRTALLIASRTTATACAPHLGRHQRVDRAVDPHRRHDARAGHGLGRGVQQRRGAGWPPPARRWCAGRRSTCGSPGSWRPGPPPSAAPAPRTPGR